MLCLKSKAVAALCGGSFLFVSRSIHTYSIQVAGNSKSKGLSVFSAFFWRKFQRSISEKYREQRT